MRNFLLLYFIAVFSNVYAQDIPIDTWRSHFSYNKALKVYSFENKTYVVGENGLFFYDQSDGSINTISKIDGLSEDDISALGFDQVRDQLIIGYSSGNLEVISGNEIIYFDLTSESQVIGSKKVNHIYSINDRAFISTDYGLLNFNLIKLEVFETYRQLGVDAEQIKVNQSVILGDSIYLATEKGILSTNYINGTNLLDPSSYNRKLIDKNIDFISEYSNSLLAAISNEGLYNYLSESWSLMSVYSNQEINGLNTDGNDIIIVGNNQVKWIKPDLTVTSINSELANNPNDADISSNTIWIADDQNGLVTNISGEFDAILPSGPTTNRVDNFFARQNIILALPGGQGTTGLPQNDSLGYNIFSNGSWSSISNLNGSLPEFKDITDATYFKDTDAYYLSSFGYGVLRVFSSGQTELFNTSNSTLTKSSAEENSLFVTSVAKSDEGLWVANYGGIQGLHLYNGTSWQAYSLPTSRITELVNTSEYLWMIIDPNYGGGVIIFNKSTGEYRYLTDASGNGGLPSKTVLSIAEDHDGLVWIGTNSGVTTISQNQNLISGTVDAVVPIFENRLLLRDEEVRSIKIDAGNRKWMGTTNGVWLFDENVVSQLNYFNTSNSPLPSNTINNIDIIPYTGEVFFGTSQGIVSYRSDATEAQSSHSNVKIFPNPISSDYMGTVGISGLAENVKIKITDASGRLIWDTRSAGGTATWNASDYNGRRASTGVYFVFSSTDDGSETFIGKIAVVN